MCHNAQIPHSEDDDPTTRVSVTVSKLPKLKSDTGRQKQAASCWTLDRSVPVKKSIFSGYIGALLMATIDFASLSRIQLLLWINADLIWELIRRLPDEFESPALSLSWTDNLRRCLLRMCPRSAEIHNILGRDRVISCWIPPDPHWWISSQIHTHGLSGRNHIPRHRAAGQQRSILAKLQRPGLRVDRWAKCLEVFGDT
jgi:hypothetical protein